MNGVWLLLGIFTLMTILGVILQILLIMRANHRKHRKARLKERRVAATIEKIEHEIGVNRNQYWYITATWTDMQTHRAYMFRGGPWPYLPPWHIGDMVIVAFDPADPQNFHIE
ncbi:MAG: DUF3592 domain-containing protein [Chloroflexota bacterium]|nr:DUF3592 domain-containing protein [Chloroflexota bacterium]